MGAAICREGMPTDATLYIMGDGVVGLQKAQGCMGDAPSPTARMEPGGEVGGARKGGDALVRKLHASDTMGNTALLHDSVWPYSAVALEDTWLLCVERTQLSDVLRGRRDLAREVIHGLYKTFTRRIKNAVFSNSAQLHIGETCDGER